MKLAQILVLAAAVVAPTLHAHTYQTAVAPATYSKYSVELGCTGNIATRDIATDAALQGLKLHTIGADITGVYHIRERHAFTLRLGYAEGGVSDTDVIGPYFYEVEGSLQNITLMPGYRYTRQLFANTSAYVGVNVGVLCQNIKDRENWNNEIRADVQKYAYGLAYSMEVGLIRKQGKHLSYFLAYQISGASNHPKLAWSYGGATYTTQLNRQRYHSIRAGLSYSF